MHNHNVQEKHIKKYKSLCKQMQKLLDEISLDCPDINIYVEDAGQWNLMSGDSHDEDGIDRQDRVITCCLVMPSGGGGW
jgi:hypothetical protein